MQRGGASVESQVEMYTRTDACTNSNQDVGPKRGDWEKHKRPHRGVHLHTKLSKGDGIDTESLVDIHTCIDA